jgi:DnaJ like chaperone protein
MLGVSEITTNAEIKGEYRKKMALLHPDKLMGKNLPAELIVFTNEQASLLNEAYQLIRKTRGFK